MGSNINTQIIVSEPEPSIAESKIKIIDEPIEPIQPQIESQEVQQKIDPLESIDDLKQKGIKNFNNKVNYHCNNEEFDKAIVFCLKIVDQTPNDIDILWQLGCCYQSINQFDQAIKIFNKILKIDPCYIDALIDKGNFCLFQKFIKIGGSYRRLNKFRSAIKAIDKALKLCPKNTDALELKAFCLEDLGDYHQAHKYYNKILSQDPTNTRIIHYKALAYQETNQFQSSIEQLKIALKYSPKNPQYLRYQAINYQYLYQYRQSIQLFLESLKYEYDHIQTHIDLAFSYMEIDEPDYAESYLFQAQELEPTNSKVFLYRAYLCFEEGKLTEAQELIKISINFTDSHYPYLLLGHIAKVQNLENLALEYYKKCIQMDEAQNYIKPYFCCALVYFELEKFEECEQQFQIAIHKMEQLKKPRQYIVQKDLHLVREIIYKYFQLLHIKKQMSDINKHKITIIFKRNNFIYDEFKFLKHDFEFLYKIATKHTKSQDIINFYENFCFIIGEQLFLQTNKKQSYYQSIKVYRQESSQIPLEIKNELIVQKNIQILVEKFSQMHEYVDSLSFGVGKLCLQISIDRHNEGIIYLEPPDLKKEICRFFTNINQTINQQCFNQKPILLALYNLSKNEQNN